MKLTTFLLLINFVCLAATSYSQPEKVSVQLRDASMKDLINNIERQTPYKFLYRDDAVENIRVNLDELDIPLDKLLKQVLEGSSLNFKILENNLIVIAQRESLQQKLVSGTVTDQKTGSPLPGVTVVITGTTVGTITDANGKFSLSPTDNARTLSFTFVGMDSQEVSIGNQRVFNIVMQEHALDLEEVVVVGFGTAKRATMTGSVSAVSSSELKNVSTTNLVNQLVGQLPGFRVTQRTGEPGAFMAQYDIRGFGTPLIVIDGVVVSQDDFVRLNPNDIDQVSILKDASAAVYGVKAANGVLLVTTKKGSIGKPKINFTASYSLSDYLSLPKVMDAYQFAVITTQNEINSGKVAGQTTFTADDIQKYKDGTYPSTDIYGMVANKYQNAQKYNLTVSGGNDRISYFTSIGKTDEVGIWKSGDLNYHTYAVRSVVTGKINDNLEAELNLNAMLDQRNSPITPAQNIFQAIFIHYLPTLHPYANDNPLYLSNPVDASHPIALTNSSISGYSKTTRNTFQGIFTLKYKVPFVNGLNAKLMYGYYNLNQFVKTWTQGFKCYTYDKPTDTYINTAMKNFPSTMYGDYSPSNRSTLDFQLNYEKVFLQKHTVKASLVYEDRHDISDDMQASKQFAINIDQFYAGLSNPTVTSSTSIGENDNQAIIGRLNYDYLAKYLVEVGFNYGGSSMFPSGKRWGFFPYATAGWRVSEEKFFKNALPYITNLKLRGSYGTMGDDAASSFQFLTGYNYPSGSYILNNTAVSGLGFRSIPNPDITWYKATTQNLGFDASVKNGLLKVSFEVFRRSRSGLLANPVAKIPGTVGASLSQANLNSDQTQGYEGVLGQSRKFGKFSYDINLNVAYTRTQNNYVERVADGNSYNNWRNNTQNRYTNITWGYVYAGQFQSQEDLNTSPAQDNLGNKTLKPGDYKYADINKDGLITSADQRPIGYGTMPNMTYGLTGSLSYGQVYLNFLIQGSSQINMNISSMYRGPLPWNRNSLSMLMDNWHHADLYDANSPWIPGKYAPAATNGTPPSDQWNSNFWIVNNSYVRLKSVELGYNLSKSISKKLGLENLRVYVNGFNFLTWSRVKDFDPEVYTSDVYPITRDVTFGLSATF